MSMTLLTPTFLQLLILIRVPVGGGIDISSATTQVQNLGFDLQESEHSGLDLVFAESELLDLDFLLDFHAAFVGRLAGSCGDRTLDSPGLPFSH